MLSLLRLERKQNSSSNPFRIRIFFFLSYSFGIETIKTFIQSCSSLKNRTRFQTKIGKVYTRFQTKSAQKPFPMVRHIPVYSLYKGVLPPRNKMQVLLFLFLLQKIRNMKTFTFIYYHLKFLLSLTQSSRVLEICFTKKDLQISDPAQHD